MNLIKRIPEPGDVILLDFPGAEKTKRRPVVIVSSSLYHWQRPDVIVGLITSQINDANKSTDYVLQDWMEARLTQPSAFRAFIVTLPRSAIIRRLGTLSDRDWRAVRERLTLALAQP